jgi:hypothetical protein
MNGRTGAAAISGVSVGAVDTYPDTCLMMSGTTFEFAYAVFSGVSDIFPLTGGGVTGWKIAQLRVEQVQGLAVFIGSAVSPYMLWSSVTPIFTSGVSEYPYRSQVTSWITSGVSEYPYRSQVTSWIGSGISPFAAGTYTPWSSVTPIFTSGVSEYPYRSQVTSWVLSGLTPYVKDWTVAMPHKICDSGNTPVPLFGVNTAEFPNGIDIIYFDGRVVSGNTTYLFTFEKWNGGSYESQLSQFPGTNVAGSQSGVTTVEAGREVFINLPTTAVYTIKGTIRFLRR